MPGEMTSVSLSRASFARVPSALYAEAGLWSPEAHDAIVKAIETVLDPSSGAPRTPDIGGKASTADLGRAIAAAI